MTEPVISVDGDPKGGFIVDVHDGERHGGFTMFVENVEAAIAEGLRRFHGQVAVVEQPEVPAQPDTPEGDTQAEGTHD